MGNLKVILYGKGIGITAISNMLMSNQRVDSLKSFENFTLFNDYVGQNKVDIAFIDADDEIDWKYIIASFFNKRIFVKIILISKDDSQSIRAYEAGVFDYLLMPVKINQLDRVIDKWMRWRSMHNLSEVM